MEKNQLYLGYKVFFPVYKVERIPVEHVSTFRFKELCFAEVQSVRFMTDNAAISLQKKKEKRKIKTIIF